MPYQINVNTCQYNQTLDMPSQTNTNRRHIFLMALEIACNMHASSTSGAHKSVSLGVQQKEETQIEAILKVAKSTRCLAYLAPLFQWGVNGAR